MCEDPITQDGNTFACRRCNECIATRRHGWVARAMAEKTLHKNTLCVALTYGNETQEQRDAAAMFCYADVRAFMGRIRAQLRRDGKNPSVRFLCAGEQGDRNGRCHWHLILYSDADLTALGTVLRHGRQLSDRSQMMTKGKHKRRLHWSLWGHGFVTFQEPDEGGMAYVLSYCLKDQFTAEKSAGTMREAKAERFATGLFRMSKRPAIGHEWLMRKLEALDASGSVLPNLQLKIPDMSGYYYPTGTFREKLLWGLVALNQRLVWSTGANAPQWASLLASCAENPKDLEILLEQAPDEDHESEETTFAKRARQEADRHRRAEFARRCGAAIPCRDCLHFLNRHQLDQLELVRIAPDDGGEWQYQPKAGGPIADRSRQRGHGINPYCREASSKLARLTFPATAPPPSGKSGHS